MGRFFVRFFHGLVSEKTFQLRVFMAEWGLKNAKGAPVLKGIHSIGALLPRCRSGLRRLPRRYP